MVLAPHDKSSAELYDEWLAQAGQGFSEIKMQVFVTCLEAAFLQGEDMSEDLIARAMVAIDRSHDG